MTGAESVSVSDDPKQRSSAADEPRADHEMDDGCSCGHDRSCCCTASCSRFSVYGAARLLPCLVCAAEMQGYRTNMEDAHAVALQLPNHPNVSYIGQTSNEWAERDEGRGAGRLPVVLHRAPCTTRVADTWCRPSQRSATLTRPLSFCSCHCPAGMFDGHNGAAAAEFMAKEMGARLNALADPTEHKQLTAAVEKADADFMLDPQLRVHGCTACMVLIKHLDGGKRTLTVANVRQQHDCAGLNLPVPRHSAAR